MGATCHAREERHKKGGQGVTRTQRGGIGEKNQQTNFE